MRELRPVGFAQKAMHHIVRIKVNSGHRPSRRNGSPGTQVSWNVELDDCAVLITHKTVIHVCAVNVPSRGRSIRIDIPGEGTLIEARTGVRSIENGDRALIIQQEAVIHKVPVNEDSQDASIWSKAAAIRTLLWASASAR